MRFCIQYRNFNNLTIKTSYPPQMDEYLESLAEAHWFTTIDTKSGYWQLDIDLKYQHKTDLVCHSDCFRFHRMQFGLCNTPETFERVVYIAFNRYKWQNCFVYINYIVVFRRWYKQH